MDEVQGPYPEGMPLSGLDALLSLFGLGLLGVKGWALVDALLRPAQAFAAAGKQRRNIWLIILGLGFAFGLFFYASVLNIVNLAGMVAALVYLLDVRPAVRGYGGGPRRPQGRSGPTTPW